MLPICHRFKVTYETMRIQSKSVSIVVDMLLCYCATTSYLRLYPWISDYKSVFDSSIFNYIEILAIN